MMDIKTFTSQPTVTDKDLEQLPNFLFEHLEEYGDNITAIKKAIDYALGNESPGGYVFLVVDNDLLVAAAVVNKTGMKEYIPENILVYIATHKNCRGKGIGKQLMKEILGSVKGDIALHVEPQNPAKKLYEKFGFINKYLEMRFINK
ncbi:MAG TPA: GNAT family N-acetyltransferase [Arachidicoccus soli]|nr:GNAT family N-acetyltransferase [Arachidicoccus soli]HEU0226738.1 GNAT family N-acetyltransferase [Arachidicoccus soli]